MRIIKKISKGFLKTILLIGFILTVGYITLRSDAFQNWAVKKAITYLSNELKTKVSIQSIHVTLINNLEIKGLYLEDQQGDTLGYFGSLKAKFNYNIIFDNKLQLARLKNVVLENARFYMVTHKGLNDYNYEFLINYFSPPGPRSATFVPFKLFINTIELRNVTYRLRDYNAEPVTGRMFDENFMEYRNIYGTISPFKLIGDSLDLGISNLSFTERSGFRVNQFTAHTTIASTTLECEDLILRTPYSKIGNFLKFSYHSWRDFSDFDSAIVMEGKLAGSVINTKDIAYFTDNLKGYVIPIRLSGTAKGTLNHLKGKKMDITVGKLNKFKGDFDFWHITDPDITSYDLDIRELYLNPSSVQQLTNTTLPDELLRIGSVRYKGSLAGTYSDFTTHGLLETAIGEIRADLNLTLPENAPEQYKGSLELHAFNLGKLLNRGDLGETTLFTTFDGEGFTIKTLNTLLDGNIYNLYYNGYNYTNITMNGAFNRQRFDGKVTINDPNINLGFNGNLDFNQTNPAGDFTANIGFVNMNKIGLGDININKLTEVKLSFEGLDIDDMNVKAALTNVVLEKNTDLYNLGNITCEISGASNNRYLNINSSLGNVNLTGKYKLSKLEAISNSLVANLFPDYFGGLKSTNESVDVRFDVDIPDSKVLSELWFPYLTFETFTAVGIYNSTQQILDLVSRANFVKYDDYKFSDISLDAKKNQGERLQLSSTTKQFYYLDSLLTDNIILGADIGSNDINFKLNVSDTSQNISGAGGGQIKLAKNTTDIRLSGSRINLGNKPFYIAENNHFRISNGNLQIDSFRIYDDIQSISANGILGSTFYEALNLKIENFHLAELNPILKKYKIELVGTSNGQFNLNGKTANPDVKSDFKIENLSVNGDSVGDVVITTFMDSVRHGIKLDGTITNGLINDLKLFGLLDLNPNNSTIDLTFNLKNAHIQPFETFTQGLFSNLNGMATASIFVKGPLESPKIYGGVVVTDASLYMDYLGLPLKVPSLNITIDDKKIWLQDFEVFDKHGSKAQAGGKIYHKNFGGLRYDIFMNDLKNFNCMNLTEDKADMFFGTAYVDGNMTVKGPADAINLKIKAKTRPKTNISLPLASSSENAGPDFIEVVDFRTITTQKIEKSLSGITMDFEFEVTKDAEIQLIFDAKFNDVIRATGDGNIRMELNTFGDFYMFGNYIIETGNYNFTALNNLINKKLTVKKGGEIKWNGNPYDAIVNLVATTTVNANPKIILSSGSSSAQQLPSTIPVDCEIHMTDNLFKPQIVLDINLSQDKKSTIFSSSELTNVINTIKSDQEETNKQFISLLVFNSFAPISASSSTAVSSNISGSITNSLSEFMSSQITNWLSQIDPNLDINVDLINSSTNNNSQQVMVTLKKKLINDRFETGITYGQAGNTSYDVNISYKVTSDGRMLLRGFNRRANAPLDNNTTINTSGLGFYYRNQRDYLFPKWHKKRYAKNH